MTQPDRFAEAAAEYHAENASRSRRADHAPPIEKANGAAPPEEPDGFYNPPGEPQKDIRAAAALDRGALTQDGMARVFAKKHADTLRYCHDTKSWFEWNGSHWRRDETEKAFQYVRETARAASEGDAVRAIKEARRVPFAAGVERFARGDAALATTSAHWDSDAYLLATPAGTVNLRTGELRPANAADMITKIAAAAPSASADCPRWRAFLDEAAGGDEELVRFLQQWAGCCLTGDVSEHALVFVYGPGGNGKTVFVNTLSGALGDYAAAAPMDAFCAAHGDRHPCDLAMLRGARLVTASETEEGRAWAESRIKQLTGGDPITARFMRCNFFTYQPQFKLTLIGNHKPALRGVDDAIRRRFLIVPFLCKPQRPDPHLEEKLKAEWPAILRWAIDGCLDWQTRGLVRPASVTNATESYFADQDTFSTWLEEECDADPGNPWKTATSADLWTSWKSFAERGGEDPGKRKSFADLMERHGFARKKGTAGRREYQGIRLKRESRYEAD